MNSNEIAVQRMHASMGLFNEPQAEERAMTSLDWGGAYLFQSQSPFWTTNKEREVLGIPAALCAVKIIADYFAGLPVEIIEDSDVSSALLNGAAFATLGGPKRAGRMVEC
jgi:hypothetical protein